MFATLESSWTRRSQHTLPPEEVAPRPPYGVLSLSLLNAWLFPPMTA